MPLRIRNPQDFWSGITFMGFGFLFARIALDYDMGRLSAMGPGWFPFVLGCLLALIGAAVTLQSFRHDPAVPQPDEEATVPVSWTGLLLVLASIAIFAASLPYLGVVLAVFAMVLVAGCAAQEVRVIELVLTAIALSALSYGLFVRGLGVPLPIWPNLGFGG